MQKMKIYLNVKQAAARYGEDPSTVWRRLKADPTFPKPKRFGPQTLRWSIAELEAWEAEQ
jgi:prophage regulatory protein